MVIETKENLACYDYSEFTYFLRLVLSDLAFKSGAVRSSAHEARAQPVKYSTWIQLPY